MLFCYQPFKLFRLKKRNIQLIEGFHEYVFCYICGEYYKPKNIIIEYLYVSTIIYCNFGFIFITLLIIFIIYSI